MADSRAQNRLSFGLSVTPMAEAYREIVAQVLVAEQVGLDLVGIQDHPYQRRFLDTFALIGDLLARTSRLRFFPDVASLPMRGPTMIAKAAASLDVMSGGRFELGIGAGGFWDAVAGMGGPRRTATESIDALEEAVTLIRGVLDGERVVRSPGPHYSVPGYPPGPPPAHRVGIWIGAYRRRGLELIGRMADGWVPSLGHLPPDRYRAAADRLDEAAQAAGRDPAAVRRLYNIGGSITHRGRGDGPPGGLLDGPVEKWVETLTGWALELGVDTFVFWPPDTGAHAVQRFAGEIAPAVRQAVEVERRR